MDVLIYVLSAMRFYLFGFIVPKVHCPGKDYFVSFAANKIYYTKTI